MAMLRSLTELELRYQMAMDALEYIASRKPKNDNDARELMAFVAELKATAQIELDRKF